MVDYKVILKLLFCFQNRTSHICSRVCFLYKSGRKCSVRPNYLEGRPSDLLLNWAVAVTPIGRMPPDLAWTLYISDSEDCIHLHLSPLKQNMRKCSLYIYIYIFDNFSIITSFVNSIKIRCYCSAIGQVSN